MEKLFEIYGKQSYDKVISDNGAVNHIRVNNNIMTHKQVEIRDGRVYMRMKKRDLLTCS
ncbi:MAG: hypothetical protein ACOC32_02160 [Nanoarchaeota archaeon]